MLHSMRHLIWAAIVVAGITEAEQLGPPVSVGIVIDTSGSTRSKLQPAQQLAARFVQANMGVDAELVNVQPHMHLRGKDYELRLIFPTGRTETIFKGKWDFDWQLGYDLADPIGVPKGTRIVTIAHFDNSPDNKFNLDPQQELHWGLQNWEEMQCGFLGVIVDRNTDISKILMPSGVSLQPRGKFGPALSMLEAGTER
jgi:hypothetical protein